MAPLVLYHTSTSPYSRSVLLLIRYLGLDAEVKVLDLLEKKEHMTPEFLKINPQHCVPTIDDDGYYLWESRAILTYLLESRAPQLVPTSPKEKAILNQRLHYDLGGLSNKLTQMALPLFSGTRQDIEPERVKELHDILFIIDEHYFPNGNEWIAGENITAADFAYVSTISTFVGFGVSLAKYPRLEAWFNRCKSLMPDYEESNAKGVQALRQFINDTWPNALATIY